MEYRYIKKGTGVKGHWSGGFTEEYSIFPQNGNYVLRSFIWRLSSATIDNDEATFTNLADFDRLLMVLDGEVELSHDGRKVNLSKYETDYFGGEEKTQSKGKITDYNLIIRKGNKGFLTQERIESVNGNTELYVSNEELETERLYDYVMNSYYCSEGFAVANFGDENIMLKKGDQLIIERDSQESVNISFLGDADIVKATVCFSYNTDAYGPTIIPPEPISYNDYIACLFLANTQFRYADKIFKKLNTIWCDEFLSSKMKTLEKYCVNFFVWLAVMLIILVALFENVTGVLPWLLITLGWAFIDSVIVSPLIYLLVLPRPVSKHVKNIDDLTPYEADLYEKEKCTNERLEKILKKYQNVYKK